MIDIWVWLEKTGLTRYADLFADNHIGLDVVDYLTEDHLKELGICIGDRLRLLQAIKAKSCEATEIAPVIALTPTNAPPLLAEAPAPPPSIPPREPDEDSLRLAEALVFASAEPVTPRGLARVLPDDIDADAVLAALRARYAGRGVELVDAGGGVMFRSALDLAPRLRKVIESPRRLPRVAMETLAIVAYHQPMTRPEIEHIRGTALSQQTLDALLELNSYNWLVFTSPIPKNCCHSRFTVTRAVSGCSGEISHFAKSSRVSRRSCFCPLARKTGSAGSTFSPGLSYWPRTITNASRGFSRSRNTSVDGIAWSIAARFAFAASHTARRWAISSFTGCAIRARSGVPPMVVSAVNPPAE